MQETITAATQSAAFVVSDLQEALAQANAVARPEGPSVADKALAAYLAGCLEAARKLQSDLAMIS